MKRKLLPLLIAGVTASGFAAADVTVYGKANLSLNSNDMEGVTDTDDNYTLNSNASRFGIKGGYSLGKDTDLVAIFKMEYEVGVDDGDVKGSELSQRNIYGGIQGNFGTLIAGKHDTPTKLAQGKVDRFNDLKLGDIKNVLEGENRESNTIMYTTPKMNGFSATIAIMPGEETGDDSNDGIADHRSAMVQYKTGDLRLALSNDSDVDGADLTRAVAEYKIGDLKLGALVQQAEDSEDSDIEQDGYVVSAEYKLAANWKLKAQYASSEDEDGSTTTAETTQMAIGVDRKLGKKAKAYAYYAQVEDDVTDLEDSTFAIGLEVKF